MTEHEYHLLLLVVAVAAVLFYQSAVREKAVALSRTAKMLHTQAEAQIQQGHPDEGAAYLAHIIAIAPDFQPASVCLRSLLEEYSFFTRDRSRSATRTGILLDSVIRKDRDELIYALDEGGKLQIYSSEQQKLSHPGVLLRNGFAFPNTTILLGSFWIIQSLQKLRMPCIDGVKISMTSLPATPQPRP